MSDPRVPLKNSLLAAVLAFLIPGAGHFYQGRKFKAIVYSTCILGSFFYGMHMSEWKAVNFSTDPTKRNLGYYAQVATGLPALPAIWQARRYTGKPEQLTAPLSKPFHGELFDAENPANAVAISGQLDLKPSGDGGDKVTGTFRGTDESGQEITLNLGGREFSLGAKVGGNPGQPVLCEVIGSEPARAGGGVQKIRGEIPREFINWYEAPLNDDEVQEINRRLGKRYELALVYTWIAGLLNILAIWDAMEGPAYGYGDEEDEDDERAKKKRDDSKEQPQPKLEATAKP